MKTSFLVLVLVICSSSVFSQWQLNGNDIYYNDGKVGIGIDSPSDMFHISGASLPVLKVESSLNSNGILRLKGGGTNSLNWNIYSTGSGSTEGSGKLIFGDGIHGDGSGVTQRMVIDEIGNIGIGTGYNEITERLEVNGNVLIKENNALILTSPNGTEFKITVDDSGNLTTSEVTSKKSASIPIDVEIYPNPAENLLTISINDKKVQEVDAEIYDISGKMIFMRNYISNSFQIKTTDFANGTYLLKLNDGKGNLIKTKKIIKD